ncbi:MAG: response regulator transcription factor, partial [Chitinophagales bacterium]|nr:response regulator transcription factor [Chitinophagales bacterium]
MSQTKILIADDHAIIRTGIRYLLTSNFRISAIEETEDCAGVREALRNQNYTHLILDLQLSDGHGIGMLPEITREYPELSVLVYTMCSEEVFGKRVLQAGAKGFLRKDSPEEEVLRALNLFLGGRKYVSPQLQAQLMRESGRQTGTINPFDELSDREILVLTQL